MKSCKLNNKVTSDMIIKDFIRKSLYKRKQNRIFHNLYIGSWEADILEITTSRYSYEYEVKISKSDFKNDALKSKRSRSFFDITTKQIKQLPDILKHDVLKQGKRTNYFYFVVPDGLIKAEDVPEWAGLIYYIRYINYDMFGQVVRVVSDFKTIKKASILHHNKVSDKAMMNYYESIYFKNYKNI